MVIASKPFSPASLSVVPHCHSVAAWRTQNNQLLSSPVLGSSQLDYLQSPTAQQTRSIMKKKKKKKSQLTTKKKHEIKMKAKREEAAKAQKDSEEGNQVAQQHSEWVEFQKSIAVEGFETGQIMEAIKGAGNRNRLRRSRRLAMKRLASRVQKEKERQKFLKVGGGLFPALSYSPEETERLLARARAALPVRTGRRGTRNLKRQARRWWLVRQIRKKYKKNIIQAHFRRMAERSARHKKSWAVIEKAPTVRSEEADYQLASFQRWDSLVRANGASDSDEDWEDVDDLSLDGKQQKM